jgi:hypothetical protein
MRKLDASLFPRRSGDFALFTRVPILYRPIMGSPEQFVVAVVSCGPGGKHLERANCLSKLAGLYGANAVGVILAIEVGLDEIADAIVDPEISIGGFNSAVTGLALGNEEIAEGRSLEEVSKTWLEAHSSLQERV